MIYKYPNVLISTTEARQGHGSKPDGTPLDIVVGSHMATLLDALAVKYPLWLFKLHSARKLNLETLNAEYFTVFNEANPREQVGHISITKRYDRNGNAELVYVVGGRRVSASRERGTTINGKHLRTAIKAVDKYFTPVPWDERLDNVYQAALQVTYYAESETERQLRQIDHSMKDSVNKFISKEWGRYVAGLTPAEQDIAAKRIEAEASHADVTKLNSAVRDGRNILTLIIEGDKYVVQSSQGVDTYSSEQLPEEVRMKIGMLKLSNLKEVLPNIGVKIANGYLIVLDLQQGA